MKVPLIKTHIYKTIFKRLSDDIKDKVFVAGGSIRDLVCDMPVKDYDIFCTSKEVCDKVIAELTEDNEELIIFTCDKYTNIRLDDKVIQVIKSFNYDSAQATIDSFDFTICQAAVYCTLSNAEEKKFTTEFVCAETFFEDVLTKFLRAASISFPVDSLRRAFKFVEKGYTPCKKTVLELVTSIRNMEKEQVSNLQKYQYYVVD